ncbi:ATP-binding cassette domain-containing protein [Laceyella putida]|uniref:ATP-binding cassette domain-containing protein n=1 Tax=Laceyella putida TaxID=110101 RepID=A0ABW2RIU9_9BACL
MEPLLEHKLLSKEEARGKALELIAKVDIPDGEEMMRRYPHELSGGMLQRIMIAIAPSCNPKLIIAEAL